MDGNDHDRWRLAWIVRVYRQTTLAEIASKFNTAGQGVQPSVAFMGPDKSCRTQY